MVSRICGVAFAALLAFGLSSCGNNTLNPLCGSARPAPLIGSLQPSTLAYSQVQDGVDLIVNGSEFVGASEVLINGAPISTVVTSPQQLKVTLTTGVISGPGTVTVSVKTPSGNSGDLGCSSGGTSSTLALAVN